LEASNTENGVKLNIGIEETAPNRALKETACKLGSGYNNLR